MKRFASILPILAGFLTVIVAQGFPPGMMRFFVGDPLSGSTYLPAPGYGIWLKAESVAAETGGYLTNWPDSSGNNYHAHIESDTTANWPTVGTGVLNGYNVMNNTNYTGLAWPEAGPKNLFRSLNAATVFIVLKSYYSGTNHDTYFHVSRGNANDGPRFSFEHLNAYDNFRLYGADQDGDAVSYTASRKILTNSWFVLEVIGSYTNSTGIITGDGETFVTAITWSGAQATQNTTPLGMWLGTRNYEQYRSACVQIAEVLVYPSRLTDAQLATTRQYLKAKFSLFSKYVDTFEDFSLGAVTSANMTNGVGWSASGVLNDYTP